ncbi:hypothetical protein EDD85DRAFT_997285 [Armillaria nabsnona]|nr:hypothetical protein EDD85DRAFT_997285 [Armillaria nabsnona]
MVALNAGAGLVLAFWHAHEPNLHCGVFTFSWKWLASTLVFDWFLAGYTKRRRSNQYDLDVTRLSIAKIAPERACTSSCINLLWFAQFVVPNTDYPSSSYPRAYALLVHGTDAMSLYDSDADLTIEPKVPCFSFIAKPKTKYYETISCVLSRRLESVIRVPDLAGVRVRESGAAVEGDDGNSGRNVSNLGANDHKETLTLYHHHGHHTDANDELKFLATLPSQSSLPLVMKWLSLLKRELPTSTPSNLVSPSSTMAFVWRYVWAAQNLEEWRVGAWWVFAGFAESDSAK